MNNPTVSVVIPSYNHEKYIEETIDSIINQTFQDFEIIITDDGSSDETVTKINNYSDSRIKLFVFEENKGACTALNNCIINSKGKYIAYVSSDDVWEPYKLEKQVKFLEENPQIPVVFTKVKIIDENGNDFTDENHFYYSVFDQQNRSRAEWLRHFFLTSNCLCHPSILIRKTVYDKIGLYNESLANLPDFEMWIRICLKYDLFILDQKLTRFRIRSENANASSSGNPKNRIRTRFEWKQIFDHYLKIDDINFFLKIFPDAQKYGKPKSELIPYFLGRLIQETKVDVKQLWGLETIYNLIQSRKIAEMLKNDYNFKYSDFIKMSSEVDAFKVINHQEDENLAYKDSIVRKMDKQLKELKLQVNNLTEDIYEMRFDTGYGRSFIQRMISNFPSLYILLKGNNGIKNTLINIRGYNVIKKNNLFDEGYYLKNYVDVRLSGMDPILHYIYYGYKEGKKPNPQFDSDYYMKAHADVRNSKLNPIIHYSLYGIHEDRKTISLSEHNVKGMPEKFQQGITDLQSSVFKSMSEDDLIKGEINNFTIEPVIQGWLAKIGDNNPRTARLKIDDDTFEIICDDFRSDLKNRNINEGHHAVEFIVPINFVDGKKHQVQLMDKVTGELISKKELAWRQFTINEGVKTRFKNKLENEKTKFENSKNKLSNLQEENAKLITLLTYSNLAKKDSLKLNVGCGSVKFPGWINIDIEPGADLVVDLRNGLPLKNNTADFIYNEHFIEHLNHEDGEKAVKEFYRVLKAGGVLRIATPELDYIIDKYMDDWNDQDWLSWPVHEYIKTRGQMINIAMREWGHEYLYNEEDLTNLLKKVGFQKITRQKLKKSDYPELSNRETRDDSRLILEAEKSPDGATEFQSSAVKSIQKKLIKGDINHSTFSDPIIRGWLAEIGNNKPRTAVLKIDNQKFEFVCDVFRSDLQKHKINEGNHAFEFTIPLHFFDGNKHEIELFDKGTGHLVASNKNSKTEELHFKDNWTKINREVAESNFITDPFITLAYLQSKNPIQTSDLKVGVFIECDLNPLASCPYIRLYSPLEHLSSKEGFKIFVYSLNYFNKEDFDQTNIDEIINCKLFDVIIIQRGGFGLETSKIILEKCKDNNIKVIYELDDDLLSINKNNKSYLYYKNRIETIDYLIENSDLLTVTTDKLSKRFNDMNKTSIIRNYLVNELRPMKSVKSNNDNNSIDIGYYGTFSHDDDLLMIKDPVCKIIEKFKKNYNIDVNFYIIGGMYKDHDESWFTKVEIPNDSIFFIPFMNWIKNNVKYDIMVAPLTDTIFNSVKSELKYIEYSALGIPGIYSDISPYNSVIQDGKNGLLAKDSVEWEEKLEKLILDQNLRIEIVENAQRDIKENYLLKYRVDEWRNTLQNSITN